MSRGKTDISGIKEYYDSNTAIFLKSRKQKETGAIHRKLYAPSVTNRYEAETYSNTLILDLVKRKNKKKILDLGCGVGGTIRFLSRYHKAEYTGMTISRKQSETAKIFNTETETADFLDTGWYKGKGVFDLIYAVESLQHNPDHEKLCRNLQMVSAPGTELIIIDDFITENYIGDNNLKYIKLFKKYWHAYGYKKLSDFISVFEKNSFRLKEIQDLSRYMKRNRILDLFSAPAALLFSLMPFKNQYIYNIIGGQSLIRLQSTGCSGYYKLTFQYKK